MKAPMVTLFFTSVGGVAVYGFQALAAQMLRQRLERKAKVSPGVRRRPRPVPRYLPPPKPVEVRRHSCGGRPIPAHSSREGP